jgi:hypothetical protein
MKRAIPTLTALLLAPLATRRGADAEVPSHIA